MEEYRLAGQHGSYALDPATVREGGQALVYRSSAGGRRLAIKVARRPGPHLGRERDALLKLQERSADAREWVVAIVDHGRTHDGRDFLVLDWYPASLEDWLEHDHPFLEVLAVLERCAEVVARLHRASDLREQYLHRDLKPGNFLVDDSVSPPRVVLADLGGVKDGRILATTQFDGLHSPGFAPAEQGLPLAQRPDPSLDAHGLAATIYTGICGRLPDSKLMPHRLSADARKLLFLHSAGPSRRDADEEREYIRLSRLPPEHFLDLTDLSALTEADKARLVNRLRDHGLNEASTGVAESLLAELCAGLDPDPRTRLRDVRRLYAVMVETREALEIAGRGMIADASQKPAAAPLSPVRRVELGAERSGAPVPPAARSATWDEVGGGTIAPTSEGEQAPPPMPPWPSTAIRHHSDGPTGGRGARLVGAVGMLAALGLAGAGGIGTAAWWWATRQAGTVPDVVAAEPVAISTGTTASASPPAASTPGPGEAVSASGVPRFPTTSSAPETGARATSPPRGGHAGVAAPQPSGPILPEPEGSLAASPAAPTVADVQAPAPTAGDGVVVRITNEHPYFPDVLLRVDGVERGRLTGPTNVSLQDGDHRIALADANDHEEIKACSWRFSAKSAAGAADELRLVGAEPLKSTAAFPLACR